MKLICYMNKFHKREFLIFTVIKGFKNQTIGYNPVKDGTVSEIADRIIEAFIAPVIRLRSSAEGESYALLMTKGLIPQSDEADVVLREFFDPMAEAFISALQQTLADDFPAAGVTRGTAAWCYQFSLGVLLLHLGDTRVERLSGGECTPNDPQVQPHLIQFIVHGIRGAVQSFHPPIKSRRPS